MFPSGVLIFASSQHNGIVPSYNIASSYHGLLHFFFKGVCGNVIPIFSRYFVLMFPAWLFIILDFLILLFGSMSSNNTIRFVVGLCLCHGLNVDL